MDKFIVKFPRSEGDVLVRMNNKRYELLESAGSAFVRCDAGEEVDLWKRHGSPYSVTKESEIDDVVKAFILGIIDASKIPEGSYLPDEAIVNQTGVTLVSNGDQAYTISADFSKLEKYVLAYEDYAGLGEQYWLAIGVSTGEESIVGLACNGVEFTDSDVANASAFGISDGGFVYFLALNEKTTEYLILENGDKSAVVSIMVMNEGD